MPAMLRHNAFSNFGGDMSTQQVVIEDWNGDGGIRIPDAALQELGVDVGDSLYLIEEFVGTTRCLVLSKTPRIPDRMDELVEAWDKGQ
jgi:antitoxin component of MazEF toxin-antitoxin module